MGIDGVKEEPDPFEAPPDLVTPEPSHAKPHSPLTAVPEATPTRPAAVSNNPLDGESGDGECNLLGDFALLVQGALGLLAVSSLVVKRWRESPRRPLKIWFFDVSKQVFGSVLLHLANILMSMLSSGKFDVAAKTSATPQHAGTNTKGDQPNPCSFYLLNLAIDVSATFSRPSALHLTMSDHNRHSHPRTASQAPPPRLHPHTPRQSPRIYTQR